MIEGLSKELTNQFYRIAKLFTHTELKINASLRRNKLLDESLVLRARNHTITLACLFARRRVS